MRTRKFASEISWPLATIGNNQRQNCSVCKATGFQRLSMILQMIFFVFMYHRAYETFIVFSWMNDFFDACCSATEIQAFSELIWLKSWDRLSDVASISFVVLNMMVVMARVSVEKYTILSHYFTTFLSYF